MGSRERAFSVMAPSALDGCFLERFQNQIVPGGGGGNVLSKVAKLLFNVCNVFKIVRLLYCICALYIIYCIWDFIFVSCFAHCLSFGKAGCKFDKINKQIL